jgi:tRNA threonylcarbamoyladenosine biosynthesis protein TsaE
MEMVFTKEDLQAVAKMVIAESKSRILAFYGDMGAGKTTLIKALLKELGAKDSGSSPTFGIVNEYHSPEGKVLAYHFDFYRLEDETEALDLGIEEYLAQQAWIFMEWPEIVESLLPEDTIPIQLEVVNATTRRISY